MINILDKIIATTLVPFLIWSGIFVELPQQPVNQNQVQSYGAFNPSGGGTYRTKSFITSSATSIGLTSFKEPVSNIPYTMSYLNSAIMYGTLEPNSPTQSEFISFTGITQNSDGSATLTGVTRGLSRSYPYTASSTIRLSHSGNSIFILSDSPQLYSEYGIKRNDETITGDWKAPNPANPTSIVNKQYVDGLVFSGIGGATETATGTVEIATRTEAASSTFNGSLGRLVIPGSMATDTPNTTATSTVVMTSPTGVINSGFLNLKTYTGQASTTQLTVSGYSYLASTSLATTTSTFFTYLQKLFATTTAQTSNGTTETTMWGINLQPAILTGGVARIRTYFDWNNFQTDGCSQQKLWERLYLGSTVIASTTMTIQDENPVEFSWTIVDSGSNTQVVSATQASTTNVFSFSNNFYSIANPTIATGTATYAINTSQALNLRMTVQLAGTDGTTCRVKAAYSYGEIIR